MSVTFSIVDNWQMFRHQLSHCLLF